MTTNTATPKGQWLRLVLVGALGSALIWVWWRWRMESLWRQPQPAPLSAQWLYASQPNYATL